MTELTRTQAPKYFHQARHPRRSLGASAPAARAATARAGRGERERRSLETLAGLADAVLILDRGTRIRFMNPAAELLTGWRQSDALGEPLARVLSICYETIGRPAENSALCALRSGAVVERADARVLVGRDARETPVLERSTPLKDERGRIDGVSLVIRDLTDHRRQQEALRQAQDALSHTCRVATLGKIAASIAHEVNQPLAGVVTNGKACLRWLDDLAEPTPSPALAEARAAVRRIVRDALRAGEIVARTRSLCKRRDLASESVDLHCLIRETVALIRHELFLHRIELRLNLAAESLTALADPVPLQQILLNLLLNGMDAIEAAEPERRELTITTYAAPGDRVCVEVSDCGIGLPPGQAAQIFDAFYTTKPDGLGMGLSISRTLAEHQGGCLRMVPQEHPGATFQLTLRTPGTGM